MVKILPINQAAAASKTPSGYLLGLDIGSIKDIINNETLEEKIKLWNRIIQRANPPFYPFYLACPNEQLDRLIEFIKDRLSIKGDIVRTKIDESKPDLTSILLTLKKDILSKKEEVVLLIATGFEKYAPKYPEQMWRLAHDYDQNIQEESEHWKKTFADFVDAKKKVVIITHIGKSLGEAAYNESVRSAIGSQFKKDILEVDLGLTK